MLALAVLAVLVGCPGVVVALSGITAGSGSGKAKAKAKGKDASGSGGAAELTASPINRLYEFRSEMHARCEVCGKKWK